MPKKRSRISSVKHEIKLIFPEELANKLIDISCNIRLKNGEKIAVELTKDNVLSNVSIELD